jgi:hypothetical protein
VLRQELSVFTDKHLNFWLDSEEVKYNTPNGMKEGAAVTREEFIQGLVELAAKIRKQSKDGGNSADDALERTMSTRTLRRFIRSAMRMGSASADLGLSALHLALDRHLGLLSTESTSLALHGMVEGVFGVPVKLVNP